MATGGEEKELEYLRSLKTAFEGQTVRSVEKTRNGTATRFIFMDGQFFEICDDILTTGTAVN